MIDLALGKGIENASKLEKSWTFLLVAWTPRKTNMTVC
jgi:hypothetical protein